MEIVITMAGQGLRFKKAGFKEPKYMIKALGKTLFEWSMDSFKSFRREEDRYIFILRKEDGAGDFIREKTLELGIKKTGIIELSEGTDGQATTALLARDIWDKNDGLYIYNIDTYVEPFNITSEEIRGDGFIPCFRGEGDHWSFVSLLKEPSLEPGNSDISMIPAKEVREKIRISDYCTLGAYYFRTCGLYEDIYREYYLSGINKGKGSAEQRERYIAPMYDHMIKKGMEIYISCIPAKKVHVLGTPSELDQFIKTGSGATDH